MRRLEAYPLLEPCSNGRGGGRVRKVVRRVIRPKTEVPEFEGWLELDDQRHGLSDLGASVDDGGLSVRAVDSDEAFGVVINCMSLGGRQRSRLDWYVESDSSRNFGESVFLVNGAGHTIHQIEFRLTSTAHGVSLRGHALSVIARIRGTSCAREEFARSSIAERCTNALLGGGVTDHGLARSGGRSACEISNLTVWPGP